MSEAGSLASDARDLLSESMDTAAEAAAELLRMPLFFAGVGAVLLSLPMLTLIVAPILLLLSPLLVPIGFGMTVFGLGRAGLIVTLRTDRAAIANRLTSRRSLSRREASDAEREEAPAVEVDTRNLRLPPHNVVEGSFRELNTLAAKRGESLVKEVGALVRNNVLRATRDISGEVEQHLHALQRELQSWASANPNLKPYCHGHIGWLLRQEASTLRAALPLPGGAPAGGGGTSSSSPPPSGRRGSHGSLPRQRPELDMSETFEELFSGLPPPTEMLSKGALARVPLPSGVEWDSLAFLLVPGLLTKWYPLYMKTLRADLRRLGLRVQFSRIDTDQPVRINAARLRHEVLEMAQEGRRVVLLGHSKGAVDSAAALSLFPELCDFVAGLVSLQGPHGGSAIAHDLSNTHVQKTVVLGALERLLRGCKYAVLDLSFEARQEFLRQHAYPIHRVPTLCVATCDRRQSSLLRPLIEYVAVRYGEVCDGLVCQADAILPHSLRVVLEDMDHFGPAWPSFPATDRYDPTRLWLVCISMTLRFGRPPRPPPPAADGPCDTPLLSFTGGTSETGAAETPPQGASPAFGTTAERASADE